MLKRMNYLPPTIEVIEVENEGVMASSIEDPANVDWPTATKSAARNDSHSFSTMQDLEDILNDILTY